MFDPDGQDLILITAKHEGGGLPVSVDERALASFSRVNGGQPVIGIAGVLAACGVGNDLRWYMTDREVGRWDGHLATDPIRRQIVARGYALQVFEDSVVVLGERHIPESSVAEWFGVQRPASDKQIQIAEATRFRAGGGVRTVLILYPLTPGRVVLPYGGRDRELERLAIESEAAAEGPVADAFSTPPIEVGIYGRHIATTWQTAAGAFPVWTSTDGARWLAHGPRMLRAKLGVEESPVDLAIAAMRSLGVTQPPDLIPLAPGDAGADLSSHLDPSEEPEHRWAVRPKETA